RSRILRLCPRGADAAPGACRERNHGGHLGRDSRGGGSSRPRADVAAADRESHRGNVWNRLPEQRAMTARVPDEAAAGAARSNQPTSSLPGSGEETMPATNSSVASGASSAPLIAVVIPSFKVKAQILGVLAAIPREVSL